MTKKQSWRKKNRDVILSVITLLISTLLAVGISNYYGEQSASGVMAISHQNSALHNGVDSRVVQMPNGFFSNADSISFKATLSMKASLGIFITCNDGTTFNGTGPFTCPTAVTTSPRGR